MKREGWQRGEGLAATLFLLLLGCSPVPESVRTATERQPPLAVLRTHPEAYRGKPALLGGRVVRVESLRDRTWIEIDGLPLDERDRPRSEGKSQGRFLAEIQEKVDASAYPWGRVVTVWGKFSGTAKGQLVVVAKEVYLWPRRFGQEPLYSSGPYREGNQGAGWDPGTWW
ncbi:MAG: Slp family lipoprotein [Methylacidiphilaceae bacterium]|nr:Slp family lipoprotein [Candidatus Methylacidiphilaceae bacterium]